MAGFLRGGDAAPAIPAAESTLGSHPCVALPSAQVLPEWINRNLAAKCFAPNGDNPLNFVSHSRGSLQPAVWRASCGGEDFCAYITRVSCGGRHFTLVKAPPDKILPLLKNKIVALKRPY